MSDKLLLQVCSHLRKVVDCIDNWNDCRISCLHPPLRHFKQTRVLRSGPRKWLPETALQPKLCRHSLATQHVASQCLPATCRWFYKHRSSITSLRLECLHSVKLIAGLRDSFIPVLFGILATTLTRLVVNSCEQVRCAWLCCMYAQQVHEIAWLCQNPHHCVASMRLGSSVSMVPTMASAAHRYCLAAGCRRLLRCGGCAIFVCT